MLETPDTIDQLLTEFIDYKSHMYVQCDFFNGLVGIALVILCCFIYAYIIEKSS